MLAAETDDLTIYGFLSLLEEDAAQPPKGLRSAHPTTLLAATAHTRLAQLGALPYRQQKGLHQALTAQTEKQTRKRPFPDSSASHLSLF